MPSHMEYDMLANRCDRLLGALQSIAGREPQIDTMPLDRAFAELREVTKIAREAVERR